MSSYAWLQRNRKQVLLDLSFQAGLSQDEDLRKDILVERLDAHLQRNAGSLSRLAVFESYYERLRNTPGRPVRDSLAPLPHPAPPHSSDSPVTEVKKLAQRAERRATIIKREEEEETVPSSILTSASAHSEIAVGATSSVRPSSTRLTTARTPALSFRARSELPGPPSPADLADVVEYESTKLTRSLVRRYRSFGAQGRIERIRDLCSSVAAVQMTFLLVEAFALQRHMMPWRFAFDVPSTSATPSFAVFYPDLFALLTSYYWSATLLWSTTSIFVPILFAYFFNLSVRDVMQNNVRVTIAKYTADPLVYNMVKALATWVVYAHGVTFGLFELETVTRVNASLYGGYSSVLIGSAIGVLAALYEAAQAKSW